MPERWKTELNPPGSCLAKPVPTDEGDLISYYIENDFIDLDYKGLYKYSLTSKDWKKLIKIDQKLNFSRPNCVALNYEKNTFYMYSDASTLKIDLNNDTFTTLDFVKCDSNASSVIINNKHHIIGGFRRDHHMIYNETDKKFIDKYDFGDKNLGLQNHGTIYDKKRNMIWILGGYSYRYRFVHSIWNYSLNKEIWRLREDIKLPNAISGFGCVVTSNYSHIIILGGADSNGLRDDIYYIDLNEDKLIITTSKIKCPKQGIFYAVLVDEYIGNQEDILVIGYIKYHCKSIDIEIIPNDVIRMITRWIGKGVIHLFDRQKVFHWTINVDFVIA